MSLAMRRPMMQCRAGSGSRCRPTGRPAADEFQQIGHGDDPECAIRPCDDQAADRLPPHHVGSSLNGGFWRNGQRWRGHQIRDRSALPDCRASATAAIPLRQHADDPSAVHNHKMMNVLLTHHIPGLFGRRGRRDRFNTVCHDILNAHRFLQPPVACRSNRPEQPQPARERYTSSDSTERTRA